MADLLTFQYPSGTKEFVPIAKTNAAEHNSVFRGEEIPYTWAELKTKVQNGDFSNLYIGDYKQITLTTNEVVIMEIAGINCYKGWGDSAIGNHIDFISRDCLATTYKFNTANTNNGTSGTPSPWLSSDLFASLTGSATNPVSTTLPSDLKPLSDMLIPKRNYYEQRYSSGGAVSADTGASWQGGGYLWIPSEIEVFGHASYSEIGYGTAGYQQYPIFRLNPNKIVKGAGNGGSRTAWWTLSARSGDATGFCFVQGYGQSQYMDANNSLHIPLCFRIG